MRHVSKEITVDTSLSKTYMFGDVVENVGLEWHLHVDGTGNPDQFTLSDIQHTIDLVHLIPTDLL